MVASAPGDCAANSFPTRLVTGPCRDHAATLGAGRGSSGRSTICDIVCASRLAQDGAGSSVAGNGSAHGTSHAQENRRLAGARDWKMKVVALPALAYAAAVFAAGFVLGVLRALLLAPRVGEALAILLEVPVMLAISFGVARWAVGRWRVPARPGPRLAMGALAFALLMVAEVALSTLGFGRTLAEHLARMLRPAALPGLAAQILFGAMPALLLLVPGPRAPR
jgi:hypothetical protein